MITRENLQLDTWYEEGNLAYRFEPFAGGTNALVRGELEALTNFVVSLGSQYRHTNPSEAIRGTLSQVLESGDSKSGDVIGFGCRDRIRNVARCDDEYCITDGPFSGERNYLQITHNEQTGGDVTEDPLFSGRALMAEHVLKALQECYKV